jgi:hypothetical protein
MDNYTGQATVLTAGDHSDGESASGVRFVPVPAPSVAEFQALVETIAVRIGHWRQTVEQNPAYSAAWKLPGQAFVQTAAVERATEVYRLGIDAAVGQEDMPAAREMTVFLKRLDKTRGG